MPTNYPELAREYVRTIGALKRELPETMTNFSALHKGALAEEVLDAKTKELIAIASGIAMRCKGCIALHVKAALKANATRREIMETVGVAVLMGGGPSMLYGTEVLTALEQFEAARKTRVPSPVPA